MPKKEQIREAAIKIIARDGFFNATTDKIAKEAKVAVGTLYNYFTSKEEILDYIFAVEFEKRAAFYQNMKNWRMDWFLKINGILNFHLQEFQKEPDIAIILLAERMNAHRYGLTSLANFSQLSLIISAILQQGIDEKKIRPCNTQNISLFISGFLNELLFAITTKTTANTAAENYNHNFDNLEQSLDEFCTLLKTSLAVSAPES